MKRRVVSVFVAMVLVLSFGLVPTALPVYAATIQTAGSGNWSSTTVNAPWPGGIVPGAGDAVTIAYGHTVTVDITNAQCSTLQLGQATLTGTATLAFNSGSQLTIGTTLTVGATGSTSRKGSIVMTNGGTLQIGTTVTIIQTGGAWTPGAGTVEYNGAAQTLPSTWMTPYNNLTLSGSGAKTIAAGISVGGNLAISSGTAPASINPGSIIAVTALTLGGVGQVNGTWGSTSSPAVHTNNTYFAATTGMLNVKTWYVDPSGADDATTHGWGPGGDAFKTIQFAVDHATQDSIISVAEGTYTGSALLVNKAGINLLGAKAGISGCPLNPADRGTSESIINFRIRLQAINIVVDGFEIHTVNADGIFIEGPASSPIIKNNVISTTTGSNSGMRSQTTDNAQILNNNIQGYNYGLNLDGNTTMASSTIDGNCISHTLIAAIILQGTLSNGHVITNNTIENNSGGGIVLGQGGDTVSGNTIRNNAGSGIFIQGGQHGTPLAPSTHDIHIDSNTISGNVNGIKIDDINGYASNNRAWFNVIICNTSYGVYSNSPNPSQFDAINNWWGCNNGPSGVGPGNGDKVSGNVTYNPWLVLNLSANPPNIPADGISTSTITADLTMNSNNLPSGGLIPNGTAVVFTTTAGSVNPTSSNTTSGIATTIFTSSTSPGSATISANADPCSTCVKTATVGLTAPNIVESKTVELVIDVDGNGVASPGDTLKYTAVINNTGNGAATGVTFTDIPDVNTTLVVGSVITVPVVSVSTGNSLGDTSVAVTFGVISSNSTATVSFKVTINKPLSVSQISNQAITTGTNFSSVKSDDPGTPQLGDPTVINLQLSRPLGGEVARINTLAVLTPWLILIFGLMIGGTILVLSRRKGS